MCKKRVVVWEFCTALTFSREALESCVRTEPTKVNCILSNERTNELFFGPCLPQEAAEADQQ